MNNDIYVVKIVYLKHMKFFANMETCDVKLFSSREKAEGFLVKNNFLYGKSYYFTETGWYHKESIKFRDVDLPRLLYADIQKVKIDDENENYWEKCAEFINYTLNGEKL